MKLDICDYVLGFAALYVLFDSSVYQNLKNIPPPHVLRNLQIERVESAYSRLLVQRDTYLDSTGMRILFDIYGGG